MQTTQPTTKNDADGIEQLSDRDVRALTEHMDIYPDDPDTTSEEIAVYNKGTRHIINPLSGYCDCEDMHFRHPDDGCKHLRRYEFEQGARTIPDWVQTDALDNSVDATPDAAAQPAIADGGMVHARDGLETEAVDGGHLVWDHDIDKVGKRLAGFAEVTDWDAIRSELVKRGIGVGAIHHKEVFDAVEVGL